MSYTQSVFADEMGGLAEKFGVSPEALQEHAAYVVRMAKAHPEQYAADPIAFIDKAMKHYNKQSVKYYKEILESPEKFDQFAADLAKEL